MYHHPSPPPLCEGIQKITISHHAESEWTHVFESITHSTHILFKILEHRRLFRPRKWLRQRKWLHPRKCLRLVVESLGEFSQRHSSWGFERGVYHTSHFLTGFILDPRGQLKTWENSARLVRGPTTRKLAGEWASFSRRSLVASSVLVEHQTWGTKYEWIYVCKLLRQGNRKQWILVMGIIDYKRNRYID